MRRKILIVILLILAAVGGYIGWKLLFGKGGNLQPMVLIPKDAVFVVETKEPVESWRKFSSSDLWKHLKTYEPLGDIGKMADELDKTIADNRTLFGLVGSRQLLISAHVLPGGKDYDFLFVVDFEKASKFGELKEGVVQLLKAAGYSRSRRDFMGTEINELFDKSDNSTLYLSFIENQMVCSFNKGIIEASIKEYASPSLAVNERFVEVTENTPQGGMCRFYLNYAYLPAYLGVYMDDAGSLASFFSSMHFSGLDADMEGDLTAFRGVTNVNDSMNSYMLALSRSGTGTGRAQEVFSNRTGFMLSMGFSDFGKFYQNLQEVWKADEKKFSEMNGSIRKVEKLLGIKLQEHFFSWIGDEVAVAQYQTDRLIQNKVRSVVAIKADNISDAEKNLDYIGNQIRKRTPLKFKEADFKGYKIRYLEMKGLFRLIFGKLFDKIEKPYYTFIDDYAVFCDDPEMLLRTVEDYINKQTLDKDASFNTFYSEFSEENTVFTYLNPDKYFVNFKGILSAESYKTASSNRQYITCFQHLGFQFVNEQGYMKTTFATQFLKPAEGVQIPSEQADSAVNDSLTEIDLFIIENVNKDALKEVYDNGNVKLLAEIKDGVNHGSYIEYYENGNVKVKGRYHEGLKRGKWKIFAEDGTLVRVEKYNRKGELKSVSDRDDGSSDAEPEEEP